MLKDAALLQLRLLTAALAEGLTLKDATPYNVQWRGTQPVFVDIGSFERARDGEPWAGYRQFCMLFLYPLMLEAFAASPSSRGFAGASTGSRRAIFAPCSRGATRSGAGCSDTSSSMRISSVGTRVAGVRCGGTAGGGLRSSARRGERRRDDELVTRCTARRNERVDRLPRRRAATTTRRRLRRRTSSVVSSGAGGAASSGTSAATTGATRGSPRSAPSSS